MKIDRLIGILSILLQKEIITAPELAEYFEVSRRTIGRDIEALCKAGIPIHTMQGSGGGISIMNGYRMDRTLLTSRDMQMILIALQQREGKGYSTLHTIRGILRPAFRMALDDDLIRKNPFDFELATVIVNDSVTRDALTRSEERKYLESVKQDKHFSRYYEGIFILFNTGLRISEFVGLTLNNLDFAHHKIIVDHQLIRTSKIRYMIEEPKTECGIREIPMIKEVEEAFKIIISKRGKPKAEPVIDGYSGFLYLDKNDMPMVALHWEKYFQHILQKYNSIYKIQMPKVTPHVCMHTFCTNMAKSGMNPKSLQYIMGHAEISITLDHYTHINFEDAEAEMKKIAAN